MSAPADVTGSQFQMFTNLANPRHTNFNQPEPAASPFIHSGNQQRGAPMRWDAQPTSTRSAVIGTKSPSPTAPAAPQFFSKHMDTRTHRSQKSRSSRRSTSTRDSRSRRSHRANRPSSQREDDPSVHSQVSLNSQQRREIRAEKDAEKMGYLMELKRMSQENRAQLTKEWSMADAHEDIELEYNRQKMANDTQDSVNFMSSGLKMAMSGIELLNHKYGPWLELDGMANDVCSDMHKYRPALTRIYKRVWRRGSINPWIELLFTLGGAVLMFHVRNKIMGGSSMPSNVASSSATGSSSFGSSFGGGNGAPIPTATRPNPARNATPFNLGPFASRTPPPPLNRNISRGPTAPPATASAPRGRMRRPTSPGGTAISRAQGAGNNPLASMMGGGGNPLASMMGGGGNPLGGMMMSTMMGGGGGGGGGANLMQGLMGGAPPPSTHSPFSRAPPTVTAPRPTAVPSFRTVVFSHQTRRQRPTSPPVILREDNDSDHGEASFQEDSVNQANIEEEDDQGSEHVAIDIDVDDA